MFAYLTNSLVSHSLTSNFIHIFFLLFFCLSVHRPLCVLSILSRRDFKSVSIFAGFSCAHIVRLYPSLTFQCFPPLTCRFRSFFFRSLFLSLSLARTCISLPLWLASLSSLSLSIQCIVHLLFEFEVSTLSLDCTLLFELDTGCFADILRLSHTHRLFSLTQGESPLGELESERLWSVRESAVRVFDAPILF